MQASALSTRCSARPVPVALRRHRVQPVASSNPQVAVATKKVIDVSEATFDAEVLQSDKPVLVDFWASWCGPCKLVAPLMEWTEKEYGSQVKVVKVEHDKNKGLIEKYKVYGLPTLLLFKDGQEVAGSKREGAITKPLISDYLKKHQIIA